MPVAGVMWAGSDGAACTASPRHLPRGCAVCGILVLLPCSIRPQVSTGNPVQRLCSLGSRRNRTCSRLLGIWESTVSFSDNASNPDVAHKDLPAGNKMPASRTRDFLTRLEVNSWSQAERHVEQAGFWENFSWITGGTSAALAAGASGTAFTDLPVIAGTLALLAAGAGALATALRPGELSSQHMKSAANYHALQQGARAVLDFDLDDEPIDVGILRRFSDRWDEVTTASPRVSQRLARKATKRYADPNALSYYPRPPGAALARAPRASGASA